MLEKLRLFLVVLEEGSLRRTAERLRESFASAPDSVAPGYNRKVIQFYRRFGKFKPRFMVPIADAGATWDLFLAWQRGKTAGFLRALIDALIKTPKQKAL